MRETPFEGTLSRGGYVRGRGDALRRCWANGRLRRALTAYLLFKNGVIQEDTVLDAQSLPKVTMPNRDGSALPAEEWKHARPRLEGYP